MVVLQKGNELELLTKLKYTTDRKIYGCAHFPEVDREKELILSEAIEKGLPDFMEHPILHYQHTERPVGVINKAEIGEDGALLLEGSIFDTPDTDDVWDEIVSGGLNKFSVFGKRIKGSQECALSPIVRSTPCVTKAMVIYSISVVGDNAMNQNTFLKVAKGGNSMPEEEEKKKEEGKDEDVEKGDAEQEMPTLAHSESNISSVLERIGNLEKAFEEMKQMPEPTEEIGKGEDEEETMEEKKEDKEVEKCSDVKKADEATPEVKEEAIEAPVTDFITKATFNDEIKKALVQIDTIQKAYNDLKERVDKMEEFAIQKGGNIVFIKEDGATDNPMIDNLKAVEG